MDINDFLPTEDDIVVELKIEKVDGTEVALTNEDGTPMTITVMAPFSEDARQATSDLQEAYIKEAMKTGKKEFSIKEREDQNIETLVVTTRDWNITWNGEKPELTKENLRNFYRRAFWAKSAVEKARVEVLNFMKD